MKTEQEITEAKQVVKEKFARKYRLVNAGLAGDSQAMAAQILGSCAMALAWVMDDNSDGEVDAFDEVIGTAVLEELARARQ